MSKLSPILKWAGGKRQLLPQIIPLIPDDINRYYEPFVGAGAVLLELCPSRATINDTNSELMTVYQVIKDHPDDLIKQLLIHDEKHSQSYYYHIRNADREQNQFEQWSIIEKAARTVYLNRTCYNGLYRVNRSGFFNTPIGRNSTIQIVNARGIRAMSEYLNAAEIKLLNVDYQIAMKEIQAGDFAFLDPPYYPTKKDSFLRYDSTPFGAKEQLDLRDFCNQLNAKGIRFIQTNSDCPEIRDLYKNYNLITAPVRRCINAKVEGRRGTELIITNY